GGKAEAPARAGENGQGSEEAKGEADSPPGERELEVQRALIRLVDAPLPPPSALAVPAGTVLFTDDGRGVARELAGRLADLGVRTALLRTGSPGQENGQGDVFHADLADERGVEELLGRVRRQVGPVAGLVHLLPLADPPAGEGPAQRMRREVR